MSESSALLRVNVSVSVLRLLLLNKFPVGTAVLEYLSGLGRAVVLVSTTKWLGSWYRVGVDWQPLDSPVDQTFETRLVFEDLQYIVQLHLTDMFSKFHRINQSHKLQDTDDWV